MNGFEAIIAVDWSAASVPVTGLNSIWIGVKTADETRCFNPATRFEAMQLLEREIEQASGRVLVGFDVCFGYPAGGLDALGLQDWKGLWKLMHDVVVDENSNANNRFHVGGLLNQRIGDAEGPFWGCPKSQVIPHLAMTKPKVSGLPEFRKTEVGVKGAQSAWKLAYAGSVGGQTLTCLARLWPFVNKLKPKRPVTVWPFEQVSNEAKEVVFAEVFLSLFDFDRSDEIRDRAQVLRCCAALAKSPLNVWFREPEKHPESMEEGWTLGVMI